MQIYPIITTIALLTTAAAANPLAEAQSGRGGNNNLKCTPGRTYCGRNVPNAWRNNNQILNRLNVDENDFDDTLFFCSEGNNGNGKLGFLADCGNNSGGNNNNRRQCVNGNRNRGNNNNRVNNRFSDRCRNPNRRNTSNSSNNSDDDDDNEDF